MEPSFTSQIVSTLLALVIVGMLAWGSLLALKRLQHGRSSGGTPARGKLEFVHALSVGAKERVVVVAYADEEWVLGVSAGRVVLLGRLPVQAAPRVDAPPLRDDSGAP
jgi:flagellar protein FliO/FliZ